jgi:hypothetical protein
MVIMQVAVLVVKELATYFHLAVLVAVVPHQMQQQ